MDTTALRHRPPSSIPPSEAEAAFVAAVPHHQRKRLGQFFTPPGIAMAMVAWACRGRPGRFLDPAVGPGVFPACAARLPRSRRPSAMHGFDIDPVALAAARRRLRDIEPSVKLRRADFLTAEVADRFDAIVCNPPYIRHHDADVADGVFDALRQRYDVRLSKMTNVYALFQLRIADLLASGGRAAVITPTEFLNADFGVAVKQALLQSGRLHGLVIIDHAAGVFDGALTTATITLLTATSTSPRSIAIAHVAHPDDVAAALDAIDRVGCDADDEPGAPNPPSSRPLEIRRIAATDLDPCQKWASHALAAPAGRVHRLATRPLTDFASCTRGIATGANAFFTLSQSEADRHGLPDAVLRPCVTKSAQARGFGWTDRDQRALIAADKKSLLLDAVGREAHAAVRRYLEYGRHLKLHERYLTRHRSPWYAVERREPADIWVSTFGRGRLRFVRNLSSALHLTAFHGIYLHAPHRHLAPALFAFLVSDAGLAAGRAQQRVYGDGLLKFEPRDVERLLVPDFDSLPPKRLDAMRRMGDDVARRSPDAMPPEWLGRLNDLFC